MHQLSFIYMTALPLCFLSFVAIGVWSVPQPVPDPLPLPLPFPAPNPAPVPAPQNPANPSRISADIPLADQHPPVARFGSFYNWTISNGTFSSSDGSPLTYTTTGLPTWLNFDATTLSIYGTPPSQPDSGSNARVQFTLTAHTTTDTASSRVAIPVTSSTTPRLNIPISTQFRNADPPLWSVYPISPTSALYDNENQRPGLRIPPPWSFSVGFQPNTFVDARTGSEDEIAYDVFRDDGTPCPNWMVFNKRDYTLDGVVPRSYLRVGGRSGGEKDGAEEDGTKVLDKIRLVLVARDREGNEGKEYFNIVVAAHDFSLSFDSAASSGNGGIGRGPFNFPFQDRLLVNVTEGTPFEVQLSPLNAFRGLAMDGKQIQRENISSVQLDTASFPWLNFDPGTWKMSGAVPDRDFASLAGDGGGTGTRAPGPMVPMTIESSFNQTLHTNLTLNLVPSFFNTANATIEITAGDGNVDADLSSYLSLALPNPEFALSIVNLTCPSTSDGDVPNSSSLKFNATSGRLAGTLPDSCRVENGEPSLATITVLSLITFSVSRLALTIFGANGSSAAQPHTGSLATHSHAKLVLGLAIAFGVLGGCAVLVLCLACLRKWARVPDTAVVDDQGEALNDREKQWYGIYDHAALTAAGGGRRSSGSMEGEMGSEDSSGIGAGYGFGYGYGWSDGRYGEEKVGSARPDLVVRPNSYIDNPPVGIGTMGLGLHRVPERSESQAGGLESPRGRMKKGEFLTKIRQRVRKVSDKYNYNSMRRQNATNRILLNNGNRPVIGKPILITSNDPTRQGPSILSISGPPGAEADYDGSGIIASNACSTIMSNSPSTSTGGRSIPRRRADFAPPTNLPIPPQVHFKEQHKTLTPSNNPFISPTTAFVDGNQGEKKRSTDSLGSISSMRAHAEEAVIQTASRATSIRSGLSHHSFNSDIGIQNGQLYINHKNSLLFQPIVPGKDTDALTGGTGGPITPSSQRPKLVPFTSASRVPVPVVSPAAVPSTVQIVGSSTTTPTPTPQANRGDAPTTRNNPRTGGHLKKSASNGSGDDLTMGLHYVQTLGLQSGSGIADLAQSHGEAIPRSGSQGLSQGRRGQGQGQQAADSLGTVSTHIRSSFSSLDSSHGASLAGVSAGLMKEGSANAMAPRPVRMIVRTGEKFKFRVPIINRGNTGAPQGSNANVALKDMYEARMISGRSLPEFLNVDINAGGRGRSGGGAEFSGTPGVMDLGVLEIGVHVKDGVFPSGSSGAGSSCVAQVVLEVVGRS